MSNQGQETLDGRDTAEVKPLALRPRQAAAALGIGQRLLWDLTKRGEIPHIRLGRAVVYPIESLRRWLDQQSARAGAGGSVPAGNRAGAGGRKTPRFRI